MEREQLKKAAEEMWQGMNTFGTGFSDDWSMEEMPSLFEIIGNLNERLQWYTLEVVNTDPEQESIREFFEKNNYSHDDKLNFLFYVRELYKQDYLIELYEYYNEESFL